MIGNSRCCEPGDVLSVEVPTRSLKTVQPGLLSADTVGKLATTQNVCFKRKQRQLHEINDKGQGTNLDYEYEEHCSNIGTVDTVSSVQAVTEYPKKLFTVVRLSNCHDLRMKIDIGADTNILTTYDIQDMPFVLSMKASSKILKGYGGSSIDNIGVSALEVCHGNKSLRVNFDIVNAPNGSNSIIGVSTALELDLITANIHDVKSKKVPALTKEKVLEEYKDCFDKVGRFPGEKYLIELVDNPKPVVHPARSVPVHLLQLYKAELEKMKKADIITVVTEPTEWVNSITPSITQDKNGKMKLRPCLDPKDLNENIRRAHYPTRTIDEILPFLHGKKIFTIIDTNKGYWHEELDYESSLLCTFNTPFWRYRFKRLPFGLVISQDVFQQKLDSIFNSIRNVSGIADDLIVAGATEEEHDAAFTKLMETARKNNVGFNSSKLQFKQKKVNFYGHTITENGLVPAEDKLQAIKSIQTPQNAKELQTLLGMVNYLNRFSLKLAEITAPLRELLKKNIHFKWEAHHQAALDRIKKELCTSQVISYYDPDPSTETILQCDASTLGLGAWIRQIDSKGEEKIVGMASRCLTPTESRYSNIERECLAVLFGLEKFEYYLLGRKVLVETEHSPLEQIFKKNLAEVPSRL